MQVFDDAGAGTHCGYSFGGRGRGRLGVTIHARHVAARAKGRAGAGEHHRADSLVARSRRQRLEQRSVQRGTECVPAIGAVQRQPQYATLQAGDQFFFLRHDLPD
ncbi:hypothetical protein D3C87_1200530 [compost metagenome]